jgi:MEKHLA domain
MSAGDAAHVQILLDSFRRLVGRELIPRSGDPEDEARRLWAAPFVVLSHGTELDPLLNYANAATVALWETTSDRLIGMPSRLTAEPVDQAARARFLSETMQRGFAMGYTGIRRSATGRRFRIVDAILWNLADAQGRYAGQAATFERVEPVDEATS